MVEYKVGDKFGNYTYIGGEMLKYGNKHLLCRCSCGREKRVQRYKLEKGLQIQCRYCASKKHGDCGTDLYVIWKLMKQRCYYKKCDSFKLYGGRGITICKRRHKYENFKSDMYNSYIEHINIYGKSNTTLDRINVNRGYCKKNCKRSTQKEQANNRRNNKFIYFNGKEYTIAELSKIYNINYYKLYARITKWKWPIEKALNIQNKYEDTKRTMCDEETRSNETSSNSNTSGETRS